LPTLPKWDTRDQEVKAKEEYKDAYYYVRHGDGVVFGFRLLVRRWFVWLICAFDAGSFGLRAHVGYG
jgi:hypothetical protein